MKFKKIPTNQNKNNKIFPQDKFFQSTLCLSIDICKTYPKT